VDGVNIVDLTDPDRGNYRGYFEGVDAVVHLGHKQGAGEAVDRFSIEIDNVRMVYNVMRCAQDAGVPRVAVASSNHAADWYEHALIHERKIEVLDPYELPLSDNFYGWAKASYEHVGFVFACGFPGFQTASGAEHHVSGIGAPREIDVAGFKDDPAGYKRDLGAYISRRDLTQLFRRAIKAPDIENEHGIPWQVVYGISNNTRAFWSLSNAHEAIGYRPEDDSEVKYANDIRGFLTGEGSTDGIGRVGLS
jgi:hypothetical protein